MEAHNPPATMAGKTEAVLAQLRKLSDELPNAANIERGGQKIRLPEGLALLDAARFLAKLHKDEDEPVQVVRRYSFRPWDGAYCADRALRRVFGTLGHDGTPGFWGPNPPRYIDVTTGPAGEQTQVPWGVLSVPVLPGVSFELGVASDPELGPLFQILAEGPRRLRAEIDGVLNLIQIELETASLYRGRAITGAVEAEFLDIDSTDPAKVVYSAETMADLDANVWTPIRHADTLRTLGVPLKRAVLLHGPFGTGKTLAAILTAQVATKHGWTFLKVRPGRDDLGAVLGTARLYAPAVVFFEDVDTVSDPSQLDADGVSVLLDSFDGLQAKGVEVMAVMTTNYPERIHKGMVRPGRLDAVIEIGALDQAGILRLIAATVPPTLLDAEAVMDAAEDVAAAFEGYTPAFVKEAADRALRYAVARVGDQLDGDTIELDDLLDALDGELIGPADLIAAATGLRPQLALMEDAPEARRAHTLDRGVSAIVAEELAPIRAALGVESDA